MKKFVKRTLTLLTTAALLVGFMEFGNPAVWAQENEKKTVTFSMERFTIGQGYLVEPVVVEIGENDTVASVTKKVLDEKKIQYYADYTYGSFYLKSVDYADTGVLNIPKEISEMEDYSDSYEYDGEVYEVGYKAPTNEAKNTLPNNGLGEGSYHDMAGWIVSVNGASDTLTTNVVEDGDVVRYQFSLYGYGADLGLKGYGITSLTVADKKALTKELAKINTDKNKWLADVTVQNAYNQAMLVATDLAAPQSAVDASVAALMKAESEIKVPEQTTTTQAATEETSTTIQSSTVVDETTNSGVEQAKIVSVTNVKTRRAKISVKKINGAAGYQYKYATTRKFKKATTKVKTTSKNVFTTGKFKKNQKCYVQVRAFVKVKGTRVFGKWSKVKSVKIRK